MCQNRKQQNFVDFEMISAINQSTNQQGKINQKHTLVESSRVNKFNVCKRLISLYATDQ